MGKAEDEPNLHTSLDNEALEHNVEATFGCGCKWIYRLVGLRCLLVLFLSVAVFLSAVFWLPPFLPFADQRDLDLDSKFKGHDIVASFNLEKPLSLLEDNISQLEDDIFNEIVVPNIKVTVLSLEPSAGSNIIKVVFAVDPDVKYSKMLPTSQSLIRASFEVLLLNQSTLRLTNSLFGEPFFFQVLKFPGGITVIPPQSAFLLQRVQILFNFTLNFSIYQVQVNFFELTSQLKSGLHLAPYENLYISLSNSKGSTVAPPTTVQSSVLLTIGNTPSMPRLKQLAQTITGSHSRNLGLNHTVFGRVKQVRLSSILQHSLHGGNGSAPSPAPLSHSHHHHHHHHNHHNANSVPAMSPAPTTLTGAPAPAYGSPARENISPAPQKSYEAKPPGCRGGNKRRYKGKAGKRSHISPASDPNMPPHPSAASPVLHVEPPVPAPVHIPRSIPASSPLPSVVFAHAQPPSKSESNEEHSKSAPVVSPSASASSADVPTVRWTVSLFLIVVLLII
ncbi:hypothetical protein CFOL_v3_17895 [Cephalotus follicularis]|uniref:DUF7036 domain-containing protein n=1 Tax=Cephalotus follicularis TaxID=3775 RepID=A0A1Q3C2I5_CEPFO|nr:hypothetical protein CFOL_v3_17895 [Cephalotus follicularis]